jgi:hypothetical protein
MSESWQRRRMIGDIGLLKFAFYLVRLSERGPDFHEVFRRSAAFSRTAITTCSGFTEGGPAAGNLAHKVDRRQCL